MRYSLVVAGAVGNFWRLETVTVLVDPIEAIFWHRVCLGLDLTSRAASAALVPVASMYVCCSVTFSTAWLLPASSSGSLAKFAAMRRASSLVSRLGDTDLTAAGLVATA